VTEWEGGEIWLNVPSTGYKDVILEYTVKTSGLSDTPQGMCLDCRLYDDSSGANYTGVVNYFCQTLHPSDPLQNIDCADFGLLEEALSVLWTGTYAPTAQSPTQQPENWTPIEVLTRKMLKEMEVGYVTRRLDFSMYDFTDDADNFGVWFRAQLNSSSDRIYIDNIRLIGRLDQ
jgi:hypothetical protein